MELPALWCLAEMDWNGEEWAQAPDQSCCHNLDERHGGLEQWTGWRYQEAEQKAHDISESTWARRPCWGQSVRFWSLKH